MARYTPPSDTAAVEAKVTLRAGAAAAGGVVDAAGVGAAAGGRAVAVSTGPLAAGAGTGPLQASSAIAIRATRPTWARALIVPTLLSPALGPSSPARQASSSHHRRSMGGRGQFAGRN